MQQKILRSTLSTIRLYALLAIISMLPASAEAQIKSTTTNGKTDRVNSIDYCFLFREGDGWPLRVRHKQSGPDVFYQYQDHEDLPKAKIDQLVSTVQNVLDDSYSPADTITRCAAALTLYDPVDSSLLLGRLAGAEKTQRQCWEAVNSECGIERDALAAKALAEVRKMVPLPGCAEAMRASQEWRAADPFPFRAENPCEGDRFQLLRALYVIKRLTTMDWLTDPALSNSSGAPYPLWKEVDLRLGVGGPIVLLKVLMQNGEHMVGVYDKESPVSQILISIDNALNDLNHAWDYQGYQSEAPQDLLLPYYLAGIVLHEARHTYGNPGKFRPHRGGRPDPGHVKCAADAGPYCDKEFKYEQPDAWAVNGAYGWDILWMNLVANFPADLSSDKSDDLLIRRFALRDMHRLLSHQIVYRPRIADLEASLGRRAPKIFARGEFVRPLLPTAEYFLEPNKSAARAIVGRPHLEITNLSANWLAVNRGDGNPSVIWLPRDAVEILP